MIIYWGKYLKINNVIDIKNNLPRLFQNARKNVTNIQRHTHLSVLYVSPILCSSLAFFLIDHLFFVNTRKTIFMNYKVPCATPHDI